LFTSSQNESLRGTNCTSFITRRLADVRSELAVKEPRYRRLWDVRLSAQLVALPPFDEVYRTVRRAFRRAGLAGK
jgi:hypothetical protein